MEPAERTLFLFVHGINPKCAGAIENATDSDSKRSLACEEPPLLGSVERHLGPFCVDRSQLLGRAAQVWVKGLDGTRSDDAMFCSLQGDLFQDQYSLRSFSDPGASPVDLARELGDRDWNTPNNPALRSHVIEAMRRYLEHRRHLSVSKRTEGRTRSDFEEALDSLYKGGPITDPAPIMAIYPDSVPSRLVVLAHSMGGLTTREYLVSDYYNQDLDKVVTFDSPHNGSWVALYNQTGPRSRWNTPSTTSAVKLSFGFLLFATFNPAVDQLATYFTIVGTAGGTVALLENYGGYLGNKFKGDEDGSRYLEPGSDELTELNSRTKIACESAGCALPSFVLYSTDGVLAPDDPSKLIGGHPVRALLPTELVDMAAAAFMTMSRDWPPSVGFGDIAFHASVAAAFAEGGWNYTQHGSLPVTSSSGRGIGIPMLDRADAAVLRHEPLTYGRQYAADAVGQIAQHRLELGAIFLGHQALQFSANVASAFFGNPYVAQPLKFYSAVQVGLLLGGEAATQFGSYAMAYAPSHNLAIAKSSTERTTLRHADARGATVELRPTWIESDLYEKPFVQVRWTDGDSTSAGSQVLRMRASDTLPSPISFRLEDLPRIEYSHPGWEDRWAVRKETHVPVGTSGTSVRRVERWSLPFQLLTEQDIRGMDLQVDDLRPDLLEQMSITVNWGKIELVWDREHAPDGSDLGTYRLTYSITGEAKSTWTSVANPVDRYGRWTVNFDAYFESSVLKDGQNQIAISLINHAGKRSVQRQFITWQATPPLVAMTFPQPWERVSGNQPHLRARVTLLYYNGLSIDPDRTGWTVDTGSNTVATPSDSAVFPYAGLREGKSEFSIDQALPPKSDGFWLATFRTVSITSEKQAKVADRRVPFTLDRRPPSLEINGSVVATRPGTEREFVLEWNDGDSGKVSALELLRARILDSSGSVVAELAPMAFAIGERMVLRWNGKASGFDVPDGRYTLKVEARDEAVPDSTTRSEILDMRKAFADAVFAWRGRMDTTLDARWSTLRSRSDLNWSETRLDFEIDGTSPLAMFEPLPTKALGKDDRLQIRFRLQDPGARDSTDAIRMRLEFTPVAGTLELKHAIDATHSDIQDALAGSRIRTEGESLEGLDFLLPDGSWKVSAFAEDASGNRTRWMDLGTIVVDRTPPSIQSLRVTHVVVPEGASITGEALLDVSGAQDVQATWISPDGIRLPATTSSSNGIWSTAYPSNLGSTKGIWRLEIHATDPTGNSTHAQTRIWVGLLPPRLRVAGATDTGIVLVNGAVALTGIAMDPMVDQHPFVSYSLQWRWKGDSLWSSDGLRVPAGRILPGSPGKSRREQTHEGTLGFWDPPTGSGSIELRLFVEDSSGDKVGREDILEVYRAADEPVSFSATTHLEPRLGTSVSTRLGMEIRNFASRRTRFNAQVLLTDSRGDLLLAKDLVDLEASRFVGTPAAPVPGAIQLWHDDGLHVRANAACRSFTVRMMLADSTAPDISCPTGWKCEQRSTETMTFPTQLGAITVRRLLELSIPAQAVGELVIDSKSAVQVSFEGDSSLTCPVSNSACSDSGTMSPIGIVRSRPGSNELVTGKANLPWCDLGSTALVEPGSASWSTEWNGLRQDGTVPSAGPASLEVVAWDPATGRIATSTATSLLVVGEGRLRAWANEEVSIATDAPAVQQQAGLGFQLEGRGASLNLRIVSGDTIIKTLQGSGAWYEGRSAALPYTSAWDGTDETGGVVTPGTYTFQVSEVDGPLRATAPVEVTGSSWKEDPSLSLSIPESRWDSTASALRITPIPELRISTGVSATLVQSDSFTYAADWSGKQTVLATPTSRFSLMVHRKRKTVKFGILFRTMLREKRYDQSLTCGGSDPFVHFERFSGVHIVELVPGQVGRVDIVGKVADDALTGTLNRMTGGPHLIEYRVVPLSEVDGLSAISPELSRWSTATIKAITSGSFILSDLSIAPTFGQFEPRPSVGPFDWVIPSAPYRCPDSLLDAFADSPGKGVQTSSDACGKTSSLDRERFNPHRNLLQFRALPWIDETRTRTRKITHKTGNTGDPRTSNRTWTEIVQEKYRFLSYSFGAKYNHCAGNSVNEYAGVHLELMVPDAYWNPPVGLENLANRFLRFDSRNKFLYGPNGYLAHDDHDNDGVGPADDDDPGEANGDIAAFEMRQFRWRPRLTDRLQFKKPCPGKPDEGSNCDSTIAWTTFHGRTDNGKVLERPQDDPLYFYEGDHGRIPETLTAWFENTPEQGNSSWSATLRQNTTSIQLGPENVGVANAKTLAVHRSAEPGNVTGSLVWWTTPPVDITVRLSGSLPDLQKSEWLKPILWPLDSVAFLGEKRRIEQECALSGSGPCRLNAASSGARFGLQDGQEPTRSEFHSLAQQQLSENLARGIHRPPELIPGGFPKGSGRILLAGELTPDATGVLRLSDSLHFSNPPAGINLIEARVEPKVVSWSGGSLLSRLDLLPSPRALFWSGPSAQGSWTLSQDPSLLGSDRLDVLRRWDPSSSSHRWSLLHLYADSTDNPPDSSLDQSASLFQFDGTWRRNPALRGIALVDPRVDYRNRSDASEAFHISSASDPSGEEGIEVARKPAVWGLPEWIELRGSVPNGTPFKLGWRDEAGAWITSGAERTSSCTPAQILDRNCSLGYLDAARLPARAEIGILVGSGAGRRFQTIPIVQGSMVSGSQPREIRSLFGEVAVNFPSGVLDGKSPTERSISVRALDPSRSALRLPSGIAVTGPVVEVLPSQTFSSNPLLQPQIKVRLTKEDLSTLSEATELGLFKIDSDEGTLVPLQDRGLTYLCETSPCTSVNAHAVEYTALTSSFSRFVLLPKSTRDSRTWSFDLEPRTGSTVRRGIHTTGISASDLVWSIDDDETLDEEADDTPPTALDPVTDAEGHLFVNLPEGIRWIFACDRNGGFAKKVQVVRQSEPFLANLETLDPIVLGTVNGGARRRLLANREGSWSLILQDQDRVLGFREGLLATPEGAMDLPPDLLGYRWSGSVQTRLSLRSNTGEVVERPGPAIRGDANLPSLHLRGSMEPTSLGWVFKGSVSATDPEGPISRLQVALQTEEGRILHSIEVAGGTAILEYPLDSHSLAGSGVRLVAIAYDLGRNHAEADSVMEFPQSGVSGNSVLWIEAEALVPLSARLAVCELESRFSARTDSVEVLEWTLPRLTGTFHLAARWRSSQPTSVGVALEDNDLGHWSLPARPSWGDLEPIGPVLNLQGGELLRVRVPKGMHWDGLALVRNPQTLVGWHPPSSPTVKRAEVWIRDEGPDDPNMAHPRIFVRNIGEDILDRYRLRIRVKTDPGQTPLFSSWWPTPLQTHWERETGDLWTLVLDRSALGLEPGESDFQGVGAALGFHLPDWGPWNRTDDPAWPGGIPGGDFTRSAFIPVFDDTGALVSEWQCHEEAPWLREEEAPDSSLELELRSSGPLSLQGAAAVKVIAEGSWPWKSTVIGLTPLDGQTLEGVLHFDGRTWPLSGWWQEIRIQNPEHQNLSVRLETPGHRRLQIQKWEE